MSRHLGSIIRSARVARGWTQQDLADRLHCSRSQVSRWETGALPARDVDLLRQIASILGIPPTDLGVAATVAGEPLAEDDVRRRELLANLAVTAAAAAAAGPARAAGAQTTRGTALTDRVRDAMLGTGLTPRVVPLEQLPVLLKRAVQDYDACHYGRLAETLPQLVASGHAAASGDAGRAVLAEVYTLITRIMIKMDDELGWLSADRARALALGSGRPLVAAEAARNLAVLSRRAGWHSQAAELVLNTARSDDLQGPDPALTAERGLLVMSASYTVAHTGDRTGMRELTAEAAALAKDLGGRVMLRDHGGGFSPVAVRLHLISAEFTAGDPLAALAVARTISPRSLPTLERRARYFTDVARAAGMAGHRDATLRALLTAERLAPEETHARPAVRDLVHGLLASGRTAPELRGLAARCGIR